MPAGDGHLKFHQSTGHLMFNPVKGIQQFGPGVPLPGPGPRPPIQTTKQGGHLVNECQLFVNALRCDTSASTSLWMTQPNASGIAAFKYQNVCYKFGGIVSPQLPPGSTLLTPAQVQAYATCEACAFVPPCSHCPTVQNFRLQIDGSGNCGCVLAIDGRYHKLLNPFDGLYDLANLNPGNLCEFRVHRFGNPGPNNLGDVSEILVSPEPGCQGGPGSSIRKLGFVAFVIINSNGTTQFFMQMYISGGGSLIPVQTTVPTNCEQIKSFTIPCNFQQPVGFSTPYLGFTVSFIPIFP